MCACLTWVRMGPPGSPEPARAAGEVGREGRWWFPGFCLRMGTEPLGGIRPDIGGAPRWREGRREGEEGIDQLLLLRMGYIPLSSSACCLVSGLVGECNVLLLKQARWKRFIITPSHTNTHTNSFALRTNFRRLRSSWETFRRGNMKYSVVVAHCCLDVQGKIEHLRQRD